MSYLAGDEDKPKNVQRCTFLKRALKELEQWETAQGELGAAGSKLQSQLPEIKKMLTAAMQESEQS